MTDRIALSDGTYALVDEADYDHLAQWVWWPHCDGYAYRQECSGRTSASRGTVRNLMMHRVIMATPEGKDTDHINRDRLDNRRHNLRVVDRAQNNYNSGTHRNNTSGHRGVSWHKTHKLWRAYIGGSKSRTELGWFKDKQDAIAARLAAEEILIQCG